MFRVRFFLFVVCLCLLQVIRAAAMFPYNPAFYLPPSIQFMFTVSPADLLHLPDAQIFTGPFYLTFSGPITVRLRSCSTTPRLFNIIRRTTPCLHRKKAPKSMQPRAKQSLRDEPPSETQDDDEVTHCQPAAMFTLDPGFSLAFSSTSPR